MSTLTRNTGRKERSLVRSNPILNRMSRVTERSAENCATYRGIAVKTSWFLLITVVGILVQLLVQAAMAGEPVWQSFKIYEKFTLELTRKEGLILIGTVLAGFICELLGVFARKTIPVTGTIYSLSQGYLISFLVFHVLKGYEYLGLEALLMTVAVVAAMSWLYSSGIVRVDKKFRTVLLALVLGSVGVGVLSFIGSLIPATRPFVEAMMRNSGLTIAMDVIGLVIAALFLISDFSTIDTCVREGYPREYEWAAAFGLTFTVLWIYFKILDLLMQMNGKNDKS